MTLYEISNLKYKDLLALAKSDNGRKETLELLYEVIGSNKD